jgi:hypothetical protein
MQYDVGQIFYLVGTETAKVIPFRIVEIVTRTTLSGQEKNYIVEMPDNKHTRVDISKLKGNIFSDINALERHMIENAKNAITNMINDALDLAEIAFEIKDIQSSYLNNNLISKFDLTEPKDDKELESVQINKENNIVKVDIGNGIVANMNIEDLQKVK